MDKIVFFHYRYINTIVHNLDNRVKIFIMVMLSVSINMVNSIYGYAVIFIYIMLALIVSKLPLLSLLKNLKMFWLLIVIIMLSSSIEISASKIPSIEFTEQGFISGLHFSIKIILIVALTTVITATISLISFRNTIEWYLSFLPFVSAKKIATIVNMIFVFIPTIFDKYTEIKNAQISRCVESRKNPVKKILFVSTALLNSILRQSDEIAYAMEARNYNENSSKVIFNKLSHVDRVILICSISISFIAVFVSYVFKN